MSNDADARHNGKVLELLSCRVGGQEFSVDIMSVREIRGWSRATSLPHAPDYVRGVINLRGTVLPVIDLGRRLGIGAAGADERAVVIVTDIGRRVVGLLVDAVSDIQTVPSSELAPPPSMAADVDSFVSALTILDGQMVRVLDLDAILPEREAAA